MRTMIIGLVLMLAAACDLGTDETLAHARQSFSTKVVKSGEAEGPPDVPDEKVFHLIQYESQVGPLAAYVTSDPGDGKKHPAIVWITGGDTNSIGDVWSPQDRSNDQSARAFRDAGMVMMFPSQRGGNENPGQREGFYGEADDILAATNYLAALPYVDANQIYLGGHSSGGTMAMIVGEYSDRYRAVFALGPAASMSLYGGDLVYCDPEDRQEMRLRSPIHWLNSVKTPMYVFEGADQVSVDLFWFMQLINSNDNLKFFKVPGHDHFTVIAPLTELLAAQIMSGSINITSESLQGLR